MSFLDNLEDNLKALESLEPGGIDDSKRREADRERALASAPWAERLKTGPCVQSLMRELTRAGFSRRTKVNFTWLGATFRIEAREVRLELEPTPTGVVAVFPDHRAPLDLEQKPDPLIQEWLALLDQRIKEEQALAAAAEADAESDLDDDQAPE